MDKKFVARKLNILKCENSDGNFAEYSIFSSEKKTIHLCQKCFQSFRKINEVNLVSGKTNELKISENIIHSTSIIESKGKRKQFSWESKELTKVTGKNLFDDVDTLMDLTMAWFYCPHTKIKFSNAECVYVMFNQRNFIFGLNGSPILEYGRTIDHVIEYFSYNIEDLILNKENAEIFYGLLSFEGE